MGSAARPPSSRAVKVEIGRQRVDGDDSRRFTPAAITFDTRAHTLTTEIKDDWEEQIKKQKETVLKVKEKYDSEMMKLKDLYAKRNEEKKKELIKAVENSTKTYEEIMAFICSEGEIN